MGVYYAGSQLKRLIGVVVLITLCVLILFFGRNLVFSPQGTTVQKPGTVQVVATMQYGEQELFCKTLSVNSSSTVMQVMHRAAVVTTSYGGGFVTSINNIASTFSLDVGIQHDWFYYVNGLLSPVGAMQYIVVDGDVIHWDYHSWSELRSSSTAIIGDFPEPFLHGFHGNVFPTTIVYEKGFEQQAYQVQSLLKRYGVQTFCVGSEYLTSDIQASHNLIIIGTYADHQYIQEINMHASELGVYVEWINGYLTVFDAAGNTRAQYEKGGVITAMQNFWNPKGTLHGENVIWMIAGLSYHDVDAAVQIFTNRTMVLKNCASVIILGDSVIKVP